MYRRPASVPGHHRELGQPLRRADRDGRHGVAGQRAHALQERLQSDLAKVQADRDARQSDLDEENATLDQVQSGLDQLATAQGTLDDLTSQLSDLIGRIQAAAAQVPEPGA